jgi:hypothetical protein
LISIWNETGFDSSIGNETGFDSSIGNEIAFLILNEIAIVFVDDDVHPVAYTFRCGKVCRSNHRNTCGSRCCSHNDHEDYIDQRESWFDDESLSSLSKIDPPFQHFVWKETGA